MAEAVVSFGVNKLLELLNQESERLLGVNEEVDKLKRELRKLQSLLKDAYAKKYESERVRNFLEDVKDIVYDAEDIIESFLLNGYGEEKWIKKLFFLICVCFFVVRREFALDLECVTKRISEVIGEMQSSGIQQLIDGGRSLSLQDRQREKREIRQTFPNSSESDFVGMEQSVDELVAQLVGDDNVHNVISISGMGGIGKTTLARQVFHHDIVRRQCHFDGFAWVCVSQQFTRKDIWQRILKELQPNDNGITHMDEYALQTKIFHLLQNGRYLIVLDDVWTKEDWERIKPVFPAKKGWKMVLTSRNETVGLHADPSCFAFRPRILTPEESWKLCERIVLTRKNEIELRVDEELETMGKKMVAYCGGLPLAVRVLGGLLTGKNTVSEWKRVYDNIGAQIVGKFGLDDRSPNSINQVLSLSYEELPLQLKHCFLYLAHFPEDKNIDVKNLFYYWAADGILTPSYYALTIQDSGEDYLEELVRRNMVMAEKNYINLRFESCQMHDVMREVCLSKAKEENFLQVVNKATTSTSTMNAQSPSRSRRLAVHIDKASKIFGRKNNKKVRSLLFYGDRLDFLIQSMTTSDFRSLPLLRVLDLSRVKFEGGKLPSSIGELIHLRFLSLEEAWVTHLPSFLQNLKLLLYLNLNVYAVQVPNVLKEMVELRYLYLPLLMVCKTKLELGDLVNLESLKNFSTKHSNVTDLCRMIKLRDLDVKVEGGCTYETLSSNLLELRDLETLSVIGSSPDHEEEFVLDLIHLKKLYLKIPVPRLSAQQRLPPHLAYICLTDCQMKEDPMPILEKLLHLKWVELSFNDFVGGRMVCSKGGFPQLCVLEISFQYALKEWIVEQGSMPCLHTLTISYCQNLKELPDGLKYIASLKELNIDRMKREFKEKLEAGGEDYHKIQHVPTVQFIRCDDD